MGDAETQVLVNLQGNADQLLSSLDKVARRGQSVANNLQKRLGQALKIGAAVGGAAVGALALAFRGSAEAARVQENAVKQLNQVIKSTGGAAGLTSREIQSMASAFQDVTNFSDEVTLAGQNMLLTFTNIGKDVFPRATETMLDMATAMKGPNATAEDLRNQAIQLGKSLNDPLKGMTALSRVGVSFTEQQKEQIAAMQEAGDIAGAQTVILDELAKEFGGQARALASPAIQAANAWGDFKEIIGGVITTVQGSVAKLALPKIQAAMAAIRPAAESISNAIKGFFGRLEAGQPLIANLSQLIIGLGATFGLNVAEATALGERFRDFATAVVTVAGKIRDFVSAATSFIGRFITAQDVLRGVAAIIGGAVLYALGGLIAALAPVVAVVAGVILAVKGLKAAFDSNFLGIRDLVEGAIGALPRIIQLARDAVTTFRQALAGEWVDAESVHILHRIAGAVGQVVAAFQDGGFAAAFEAAKEAASRLFGVLLETVQANLPTWLATLGEWAKAAGSWLADAVPVVLSMLGNLVSTLLSALIARLPSFVAALQSWGRAAWQWIVDAMPTLRSNLATLLSNLVVWATTEVLPAIISFALEWGERFALWVIESLPGLLANLAEFLANVQTWAVETMLPMIVERAKEFALALWKWVEVELLPKLGPALDKVRELAVEALKNVLTAAKDKALEVGRGIMEGIAQGIRDAAGAVLGAIEGAVGGAIERAKSLLRLQSPSKVFYGFGEDTIQGYVNAINRGSRSVERAVGDTFGAGVSAGFGVTRPAAATAATSPATSISPGAITINLSGTGSTREDAQILADTLRDTLAAIGAINV